MLKIRKQVRPHQKRRKARRKPLRALRGKLFWRQDFSSRTELPPPRYLKPGDVVELGIAGLGSQRQDVIADSE